MLFLMVFGRFPEKFSLGIFFSPSKPNTIRLQAKHQTFYIFSGVFFILLRYDYPFDATLVLWQYESRIKRGLLYCTVLYCTFVLWCLPICASQLTDFVI